MPKLVYNANLFPFVEGQAIVGSDIDDGFTKITDLINSTHLDKDNFRPFAGIQNAQKLSPYSVVPISFCYPEFSTANSTATFAGVVAYPHYAQHEILPIDRSGADGIVTDKVATSPTRTFKVLGMDAVYLGAGAGVDLVDPDAIFFDLTARRALDGKITKVTGAVTLSAANKNVLAFDTGLTDLEACDYVSVDMRLSIGATQRTIYNTLCTLWLLMPHVP